MKEDTTEIHFCYITSKGRIIACGVCLRNKCVEDHNEVVNSNYGCRNCKRIIQETDLLVMIEDL